MRDNYGEPLLNAVMLLDQFDLRQIQKYNDLETTSQTAAAYAMIAVVKELKTINRYLRFMLAQKEKDERNDERFNRGTDYPRVDICDVGGSTSGDQRTP